MPTVIDSLFVALGWKVDPKELEGFAKKTEEAKHLALGLVAAVTGAAYGIKHMVQSASERMGGIQRFSEQMGIGAREVAALGRVATENGSNLEAMEGGLRGMTIMAGQAAQGVGRGAMIFKRFGIQVKDTHGQVKPMDQLLGDVADKMQRLPSLAQKQALGSRFGFDPATIALLSQGKEKFNELREAALKANPFGEKSYEDALATEEGFKKAEASVSRLKDRLAVGLMPTVNAIIKRFITWTSDERNIAKLRDGINKVVEVVSLVARNLDKVLAVLAVIYAHKYGLMFIGWASSLVSFVGQLKNAASVTALLSMGFKALQGVLTGGVLGLLVLVGEDLWTFHKGGVSVTGWMMTKFPYAVQVMQVALAALGAAFLALTFSSGPVGIFAFAIGGIIIAAKELRDAWNPVCQWFGEVWDTLAGKIAWFVNKISAPLRWVAKKLGIDLSALILDEDPASTRNKEFNARAREAAARGRGQAPHGPIESAAYERYADRAGAMLPGMNIIMPALGRGATFPGMAMPFLGQAPALIGATGGGSVSTVTTGDLHFHIDGSKLGANDSEKLFREFSQKLQDRGIMPASKDAARVRTRNNQPGAL